MMKKLLICSTLSLCAVEATATPVIEQIKTGMGYSQFKQWAIENKLVFENFTKDTITIRDTGMQHQERTRINVRFCGGDDYAGRATQITIQEHIPAIADALKLQRYYIEKLGGPFDDKSTLPNAVQVRTSSNDAIDGLAVNYEKDKESWDVGLFTTNGSEKLLLQTILKKESVCE